MARAKQICPLAAFAAAAAGQAAVTPDALNGAAQAAAPAPAPIIKAGTNGLWIQSPDRNLKLRVGTLLQTDGRVCLNDDGLGGKNGLIVRRARLELSGAIYDQFTYRILPDFAPATPTLLDAWLNWRIRPELQMMAGHLKVPAGLERVQPREDNLMSEFGYPTGLVPNRDFGVALHGEALPGALDYYLGAFDGTPDGQSTLGESGGGASLAGRLFAHPFGAWSRSPLKHLGAGVGGAFGRDRYLPASYRTVGQETFFGWRNDVRDDGATERLVPQACYYHGPFGILGEYAISSHRVQNKAGSGTIRNTAWQATGSWVLTGEEAAFDGVKPERPIGFGEKRGWGAWQLTARVTELDVGANAFPRFADPAVSAARARSCGLGLNWYWNSMVRITTDYNWTQFGGLRRPDEQAVIARLQLHF